MVELISAVQKLTLTSPELPPAAAAGDRLAVRDGRHHSADLIRRMTRKFTSEMTAISRKSAQPIADA